MVSQFRKQKLYFVFTVYLDLDRNGKFDIKDIEAIAEKMMLHKKYDKKVLCERWMKILNGMLEFIGVDRTGALYFDEWVAAWTKYAENLTIEPTWFKTFWEITLDYLGDFKRNIMTLDTYVGGFTHFGVGREVTTSSYKQMSQNKSTLDKNDVFKLWKEYYISDDPNVPGNYFIAKFGF